MLQKAVADSSSVPYKGEVAITFQSKCVKEEVEDDGGHAPGPNLSLEMVFP